MIDREEFFDCVEELVRGSVIRERQAATEEYASRFEERLREEGCYEREKVDMKRLKRLLVEGRVDVGVLTTMLTGKVSE